MFKINDIVTWTSQANGCWKQKVGIVAQVVAAGQLPDRDQFRTLYTGAGVGMARGHESYVVKVGSRIYWPRVSALKAAHALTDPQRDILKHTLGLDYQKKPFRNHFVAGTGHHDMPVLLELEKAGLMIRRKNALCPDDETFHVTPAGYASLGVTLPDR
jgi:hypothetical protein